MHEDRAQPEIDGAAQADHRAALAHEGWTLIRDAVSPDLVAEIRQWAAGAARRAAATPTLEAEFDAIGAEGGGARKLRRMFWDDPDFWSGMLARSGLAARAVALVGPDASLAFHAAFLKSGGGGAATPFHQDQAFWRYRYPGAVSMWLALHDTDANNGCMALCPGSHRMPILRHQSHRPDWVHPGIDLAAHDMTAVPVPMAAGDLLAWDRNMIHGSAANHSPGDRWGVVMVVVDGGAEGFRAFDSQPLAVLATS